MCFILFFLTRMKILNISVNSEEDEAKMVDDETKKVKHTQKRLIKVVPFCQMVSCNCMAPI